MTARRELEAQLELWGGVECTLNRVGNRRFDQISRTRHFLREGDLEKIAQLGITKIRYPVLWEHVAPAGLDNAHWVTTDRQLKLLLELKIEPIAGLLHHGCGPDNCGLLDPLFPQKFAAYALAVARRYPWLRYYTPINEPLTTARFSGLYGHWHPHAKDDRVFSEILVNQCRAILLAMKAIRSVNPEALLVVTEDFAPIYSTPLLAYQAEFENERRWASLDLLNGRLIRGTRMREHFRWLGLPDDQFSWFEDNGQTPDIIGIDYYPTSERFLDERWYRYPPSACGGNNIHEYADVEAVRVREEGIAGHLPLMIEAWDRYHVSLAITECHIACPVAEQIAWFDECWQAAKRALDYGVDVWGVTLWSLLGAYDWDSLCTVDRGYYEPGVFDISSGKLVETKLAAAVKQIVNGSLSGFRSQGWWNRPDRLLFSPVSARLPNVIFDKEAALSR